MTTEVLRPWTDLVKLHPDVEAGALTEAVFAIDLGAIAAGDPNVPVVNRDPEAFFRATYLTADLRCSTSGPARSDSHGRSDQRLQRVPGLRAGLRSGHGDGPIVEEVACSRMIDSDGPLKP